MFWSRSTASDGCSIWSEDLFNMEQLTNDDTDGRDFYLKLAASEFLSNVHPTLSANSRSKRWKWIFLALVVSMTLSTTALFYCMWRRRKLQKKGEDLLKFDIGTSVGPANCTRNEASKSLVGGNKEVDLPLFSFTSVSATTDNFSDANKLGEGGLTCLQDPIKHRILNWELRVDIIEGIAQGLLYLHQYSRLRIIHRNLKASNILLDKDMNPKISNFGLARIFAGNGSQATNRIVGTYHGTCGRVAWDRT